MRRWVSIGLFVGWLVLLAGGANAGIHLALAPSTIRVEPGESFDVELAIPEADSSFNAFDAFVRFDPAQLTFVPRSKAEQEGPLFANACSNTFHSFQVVNDSTLSITDALLCAGVSVTGPGTIYQLRFIAGPSAAVTPLRFVGNTRFFEAGIGIQPVVTEDALVLIGVDTGQPPPRPATGLDLDVYPNPFNPRATILVRLPQPGRTRVTIYAASGQLVKTLLDAEYPEGSHRLSWAGRDQAERAVSSGIYFIRLETTSGGAVRRVTLLK